MHAAPARAPSRDRVCATAGALVDRMSRSRLNLRKLMPAFRAEGQRLYPADGRERQLAVEMRKHCATARRLVAERRPERPGINRHQEKVYHAGEMPRRRL